MSKKSSTNKKDDEKNIDSSKEKESASIPLEDYEKIQKKATKKSNRTKK